MSNENRRNAYRIPFQAVAELHYKGETLPCEIADLSAGGLRLACRAPVKQGEQIKLGLRLFDDLKKAAGLDYLHFEVEVLEVIEGAPEATYPRTLRCRNLTPEGSPAYERARKIVFTAERQRLASDSGVANASGMASDPMRREGLKPAAQAPRYSRGSINPLHRDQS